MINSSKKALLTLAPALFAFGMMTGCGSSASDSSSVKVTNGVEIKESAHPSTVLLVLELDGGQGLCTGTFVNDSQVVTAGHCVEGLSKVSPKVFYATEKKGEMAAIAQAVSFVRNPKYSIALGVSPYDVAVITFPARTAPAITPIASATPAVGTEFTIVGYGNNANYNNETGVLDGSGAGVKREGTNVIGAIQDDMIAFAGVTGTEAVEPTEKGTYVSSGEGDSGGPMFVNNQIVGVTSGGGLSKAEDGTDIALSFYVDLNNPINKAFLASAIK